MERIKADRSGTNASANNLSDGKLVTGGHWIFWGCVVHNTRPGGGFGRRGEVDFLIYLRGGTS